jgi:signal transduction histidine kinase
MITGEKDRIILDFVRQEAPIFFLLLNSTGTVVETNRYTVDLVGEELRSKTIWDIFLNFSQSITLSKLIQNPDHIHLLHVTTSTGLPQSLYFRFVDLGEEILALGKLDHHELEVMRKSLVEMNNELSYLTRKLHKKNSELEKLNQLKNQFLGFAAHDLRKPIGVIMSYSEFLLAEISTVLSDEQRRFLQTINSLSGFMKVLVDEFLDIAKIESGQCLLDLEPQDINAIIGKSIASNDILARRGEISLTFDGQEHIPRIMLDGPKIEQALNNLVANAIEHSGPQSTVEIVSSHDGHEVTVSVRDQGCGLSQEEVQNLFKPFTGTGRMKPSGEKSTGLGLVIASKIIEAHQGNIWVESKIGKGATFGFSIPLRPSTGGKSTDEQGSITGSG